MQESLVSVVIPNYNYAHFLHEAIDSVLAQTYQNIEVIVVDDGSRDDSLDIVKGYGEKIKVVFQRNEGVSVARNNGAAQSRGEFLAFLDADDAWLPLKLERQLEAIAADPEIGLVHTGVVDVDVAGNPLQEHLDGMDGWVSNELLRFERPVILGGGSSALVRREKFEEAGGFDIRLSTSADWDFAYQVSQRTKIGFVPKVLVKYRAHGGNMHGNIRLMEHDMLLGFEKAFANGAKADQGECYGNLHRTLAGSYFYAGQYLDSARHALKSIKYRPSNLGYFAKFPLRRLQRG